MVTVDVVDQLLVVLAQALIIRACRHTPGIVE